MAVRTVTTDELSNYVGRSVQVVVENQASLTISVRGVLKSVTPTLSGYYAVKFSSFDQSYVPINGKGHLWYAQEREDISPSYMATQGKKWLVVIPDDDLDFILDDADEYDDEFDKIPDWKMDDDFNKIWDYANTWVKENKKNLTTTQEVILTADLAAYTMTLRGGE